MTALQLYMLDFFFQPWFQFQAAATREERRLLSDGLTQDQTGPRPQTVTGTAVQNPVPPYSTAVSLHSTAVLQYYCTVLQYCSITVQVL